MYLQALLIRSKFLLRKFSSPFSKYLSNVKKAAGMRVSTLRHSFFGTQALIGCVSPEIGLDVLEALP